MARVVGWNKCKATAPAGGVASSLMVTLILCGFLLLLTATEISAASNTSFSASLQHRPASPNNRQIRPRAAEQGNSSMMGSLVAPVTNIITPLISLMGSSMQQLDSALRWLASMSQEEIDRIYTPSPLIEYSRSFRTTLIQISHRLSSALSHANSAAKEIQSTVKSVNRNIAKVPKQLDSFNNNRLPDVINATVSEITKLSKKNVELASKGAYELGGFVNLTKAVAEAVREIYRSKLELVNRTAEKEKGLVAELSQLEKEILSLNSSHTILLNQTINQNKVTFYAQVADIVRKWETIILKENPCVDNYLQADSYPNNANLLMNCPIQIEEERDIFNAASLIVGTEMPAKIQLLHDMESRMGQMRESRNALKIDIKANNQKKLRLNEDIEMLKESKNPLEKMKLEGGKLADGWGNLTDRCWRISSDVNGLNTVLLTKLLGGSQMDYSDHYKSTRTTPNKDSLDDLPAIINQKLKKLEEDVRLLDKMTGVYVRAYEGQLENLMAKVEQITIATDKNEIPTRLEEELKTLTTKAAENVQKIIMSSEGTKKKQGTQ